MKNYTVDQVYVYNFVSDFCSKCRANRSLLAIYLDSEHIIEINILQRNSIMEQIQPRMTPSLVVVNPDGLVLFTHEGIIGLKELESVNLLL